MEKFPSTNMARSLLFSCFSTIMNFFLGCFFKGIYNKVFDEKKQGMNKHLYFVFISLLVPCFITIINFALIPGYFKGIYNKIFEEKNREQINICVILSNEIAW